MSDYTDYKQGIEKFDESLILGSLVWYSVSHELHVPHDTMVAALTTAGLERWAPKPPNPSNVFRRVSSQAERKKVESDSDPNIRFNYLVRPVSDDDEFIDRKIVRERVNRSGKKLDHMVVADVQFDKNRTAVTANFHVNDQLATEIVNTVRSEFNRWRNAHDGMKVRQQIRNLLSASHATAVRPSGGIYFVSKAFKNELSALESFVDALPSSHVSVHTLPLVDTGQQRDMLRQAYEDESLEEIDKLMSEMKEAASSQPRIDKVARLVSEFRTQRQKADEYRTLLDDKLGSVSAQLDIAEKMAMNLLKSARIEE